MPPHSKRFHPARAIRDPLSHTWAGQACGATSRLRYILHMWRSPHCIPKPRDGFLPTISFVELVRPLAYPVWSSQIHRPMATSNASRATTSAMMAIMKLPELPGGPAGPWGPVSPAGPATPCCPVWPMYPCGPLSPAGPVAPSVPSAPAGPAGPASPRRPGRPSGPSGPSGPGSPGGPCGPAGPRIIVGAEVAVGRGVFAGRRVLVGRGVLVGVVLTLSVKFRSSPAADHVNLSLASNPLTRNEIVLPAWDVPVSDGGISRKKVPLALVFILSTSLPSINAWTSVPSGAILPSKYAVPKTVWGTSPCADARAGTLARIAKRVTMKNTLVRVSFIEELSVIATLPTLPMPKLGCRSPILASGKAIAELGCHSGPGKLNRLSLAGSTGTMPLPASPSSHTIDITV